MQLALLLGRGIDEADTLGARPVGVVNEEFVKTYFSGGNPIGQHFQLISPVSGVDPTDIEIVGVSKNSRDLGSLRRPIPPAVYIPYSRGQQNLVSMVYEVRSGGDPRSLIPTVRQLVRQAGARIPVTGLKTLAEQGDQAINQERILAMLSAAVAILAMAIASVGIYSTVAYDVARRTNEIGVRMALGAQRRHVVWMALREVLALSIAGIAIGLPAAFGVSHLVQSLLFAVKPNDPAALTLAAAILFTSAAMAAFAPARRASRIDPMAALRHE
jgi:ABC-type antimicrobial peptide transport system permease subunit